MDFAGFWKRLLAAIIDGIIITIAERGLIIVACTKRKQGLHDLLTGCLVINEKEEQEDI